MNTICIALAGLSVALEMECRPAASLYRDFRTEQPADACVRLTEEDIDLSSGQAGKAYVRTPRVLRKVSEALLPFGVFLMHGAAVAVGGEAYLFTAPSGTGKTTHARLWLENCPGAFVVNGDKPFIRVGKGRPLACSSPWAGKENLYTCEDVPLKAIVMMEQAAVNRIWSVPFAEAFPTLLQQVYRPKDEALMHQTLALMKMLGTSVQFWRFQCNNFAQDCFDTAYGVLAGGSR